MATRPNPICQDADLLNRIREVEDVKAIDTLEEARAVLDQSTRYASQQVQAVCVISEKGSKKDAQRLLQALTGVNHGDRSGPYYSDTTTRTYLEGRLAGTTAEKAAAYELARKDPVKFRSVFGILSDLRTEMNRVDLDGLPDRKEGYDPITMTDPVFGMHMDSSGNPRGLYFLELVHDAWFGSAKN